jgi:diadenosine tetraphosphate (Ap4A) HIT family hydrolase
MPESAEEVYARVVAQVGKDGRLPMPPVEEWDMFPWELVEGELKPKVLAPPLAAEEPRWGEGDKPCACEKGEPANAIWGNDRWVVKSTDKPVGMPLVLFLESREHLDFDEMDDELAAELGRVTSWLHRIMARLPHIGRVHVCKWGDGSAHLHVWFIARTARLPHVRGSMAVEWNEMLPPGPEDVWRADLKRVADRLATHDGEALI